MRCASVVAQGHTLPSQTFFEPVIAQLQLSHRLLKVGMLALEAADLIGVGCPGSIAREPLLASCQEILAPAVIQIGIDALARRHSAAIQLSPLRPSRTILICSSVENLRRVLRRLSLTAVSVFDLPMMILLYFSLKVADGSLSESGHLVPSWLTAHSVRLQTNGTGVWSC